jgi:hypothetical protein
VRNHFNASRPISAKFRQKCDRFRVRMNSSFTLNLSRPINNADRC